MKRGRRRQRISRQRIHAARLAGVNIIPPASRTGRVRRFWRETPATNPRAGSGQLPLAICRGPPLISGLEMPIGTYSSQPATSPTIAFRRRGVSVSSQPWRSSRRAGWPCARRALAAPPNFVSKHGQPCVLSVGAWPYSFDLRMSVFAARAHFFAKQSADSVVLLCSARLDAARSGVAGHGTA